MLESLFQHTPPEFSETRVREILQRHYFPDVADIDVQLKPLNSERDLNIRVQVPTGIFVLKIANRAERSELLTCQQAVLDRLSTAIPVLPVPKVIESISGQQLLLEEFEEVSHCVRLVTWLPGELMHRVEPTRPITRPTGPGSGGFHSSRCPTQNYLGFTARWQYSGSSATRRAGRSTRAGGTLS